MHVHDDPNKVFTGSTPAKIVSFIITGIALVGICALLFLGLDQAFAHHKNHEGILVGYSYQGGMISFGMVATPKPNEQGAQTPVISASSGVWYLQVKTHEGVLETVMCTMQKLRLQIGEKVMYQQKIGAFTSIELGMPSCV